MEVYHAAQTGLEDMDLPEPVEMVTAGETQAALCPQESAEDEMERADVYAPDGETGTWTFSLTWNPQAAPMARDILLNMISTVYPGEEACVVHAQCEICGGYYPEGNIFRNHICAGEWFDPEAGEGALEVGKASGAAASDTPKKPTDQSESEEVEYVYCEICGGTYEAGNVFRNHVCEPVD